MLLEIYAVHVVLDFPNQILGPIPFHVEHPPPMGILYAVAAYYIHEVCLSDTLNVVLYDSRLSRRYCMNRVVT